ncbi:MAG: folate-binding protein [Pseudomonadota bacterium]|nr:folate-binding protein [Pseudomonadota bacterium]
MTISTPTFPVSGIAELTHLGVIRAVGEDAVKFLQGQLTQDVALQGLSEARLAAFCNAKGRMQASFVVFKRSADDIVLICSRDILAATLKRLSMFVLRAKVRLSDASADFQLYGLAGEAVGAIAGAGHSAWTKTDIGEASVAFLYPGAGQPRALWCAPAGAPAPEGAPLALGLWEWLAVQSGIAMITQPIFEAFVPQMLNYESVGGVNFKKGCYPGQEIVARSQYRGTIKRRAYLVHAETAASVGQEVFHALDAEQPCGLVAATATSPLGGFDAIVSMQTSAAADAEAHADENRLTLGDATGPALKLLPLPYALLESI